MCRVGGALRAGWLAGVRVTVTTERQAGVQSQSGIGRRIFYFILFFSSPIPTFWGGLAVSTSLGERERESKSRLPASIEARNEITRRRVSQKIKINKIKLEKKERERQAAAAAGTNTKPR